MTDQRTLRAVRGQVDARGVHVPLDPLSVEDRRRVVDTFVTLIDGLYAHAPQKRATYGHDAAQRLRSLHTRLARIDEREFHRSIAEIVNDLHDAHTRYLGPSRTHERVACLPVLIERYVERSEEHYMVARVFSFRPEDAARFEEIGFEPGVEVTHWNGVPIARAVELHGETETGGRADARRARALESLTLRPLRYALLPDEEWVVVTFLHDGERRDVRLEWICIREKDLPRIANKEGDLDLVYAGDPAAEAARRIKKMLIAPDRWYEARQRARAGVAAPRAIVRKGGEWLYGAFEDAVSAREVPYEGGSFGHLRIWTFDVSDDSGFVADVAALLARLPRRGLVVDVRGNPGGLVWAAERLLQLFTPTRIVPCGFSILATDLTRRMAHAPQNRRSLEPWRRSLESAEISGELYSREVPLTPPERCNDVGQKYPGPVVLVVDARTYSSGDLFAAGFVDHRIGPVVSVDEGTGGGGANVWYDAQFRRALRGTPSELLPLPEGITYTMAFRRAVRSGISAGRGIEDLGIAGRFRHDLTSRDLLDQNHDLMQFCGRLLSSEVVTDAEVAFDDDCLTVRTENLDRVDIVVDGRPVGSKKTGQRFGPAEVIHPFEEPWSELEVRCFAGDVLRQRRLLRSSDRPGRPAPSST